MILKEKISKVVISTQRIHGIGLVVYSGESISKKYLFVKNESYKHGFNMSLSINPKKW